MTLATVTAAQAAWGDDILTISQVCTDGLAYAQGPVAFKAPLAADEQFRGTYAGALSCLGAETFQAPRTVISDGSGFDIAGWTAVRFDNVGVITSGTQAMAMGNCRGYHLGHPGHGHGQLLLR